jgi:hypothetical protein
VFLHTAGECCILLLSPVCVCTLPHS